MLGAIIGDVAGSYYEVLEMKKMKSGRSYEDRMKIMDYDVPLFTEKSSVTDDSILTMAIMDAVVSNGDYEEYLKDYAKEELEFGLDMYGRSRFSPDFIKWVNDEKVGNSYGNGAAMRVSPIGFMYDNFEKVKEETIKATISSHNSEEAIKGALAISTSIYLLKMGFTKYDVLDYVKFNFYDLDFDLEDLRHNYRFSSLASDTVPEALFIFFNSNDFEDSIRKAISIGGDSDTIASMVGALSEAYYGIDSDLVEAVKPYLKDYMLSLLNNYYGSKKLVRK